MSDRSGTVDGVGAPVAEAPAQRVVPSWAWVLFKGLVPWAVVIAIWEIAAASGWSGSVLFPPPSAFLSYAIESDFRVGFGGDAMPIPIAILVSALRVLAGLAIGFAAALATGILISASGSFSDMILPLVRGLAPIAPIAWIPLGIVLFGIGNPTAVFVVFMGVYFILTISTVAAVKAVDQRLIKTARSFGASKAQVWTRVIFPAVLPQVFTMLRINFFAAWMAVLAAEMVGVKNGLGMMIILGREMFNTKLILLGMCIVGATGYAVDVLLVQIQRKILWWQQSMTTLTCQHVGKVWPGAGGTSVAALRDIDMTVENGEFVAILGPSGCGKSTLLELIAGLEPLSSGRITLDGKPVTGPAPGVVMVFQDHSLFPWLTVRDNVGFGLAMKKVPKPQREARVNELLERVRLSKFADHRPHQLSGGMKQRVAIARALVESPEFIMMDEPFAALDFQTRVLMQKFLLEVWLEFKPTIIFVTHHIDEAVLLADRVVVMSAGPGRIIDEVRIDLPRPRRMTDPGFNDYRARLTETLEREVMRAHAEDEGLAVASAA